MLLPPVYLAVRTAGAGTDALRLIFSASTLAILTRSILLVVIVTSVCTVLGVMIAWLTIRTDLPFRRLFTVLTALPLVIPSYVFALLVVLALGPKGTLQNLLEPLGVDRMPSIFGLPGAALTLSLLSFPYVMLPVRAAFYRMDPALEEASRSLGKGAWATFRLVTVPLLRPAVITGALLVALYTLSDFGAVSLLRYQTFTWAIFIQFESALDTSIAAALSLVLVVLATTILFLESWTRGRGRVHRVTPGTARAMHIVKLGRWRWPATGVLGLLVVLSLVAPMALLLYWVARGVGAGESLSALWGDLAGTLLVSLTAAVAAALAGIPIAMLSVRYPSLISSALERLTFIGFALPGVTVALAFVFFASAIARPLYGTTFLLVVAYLVLFLPASVGATQASLRQVSPRIEEAARGLGKTSFQAFRLITLPLVVRGVIAGGSLVFLLTMKELPATLILAPIGFDTLATSVWAAASEAFFARAAIPALVLVLMASVPLAVIAIRDRNDEGASPSASPPHRPRP
ncbi:MAG: iron ABC transporter permease [Chloroflexi bacterium]|nr:iron ABC transporter permease [Chloroflexota bacterium]